MAKSWPSNARPVAETVYTDPHPQSVAIVDAFAERKRLELAGAGGRIVYGEYAERGPGAFMGDLGPHQAFRGAAGTVGYTLEPVGLQNGLPSPEPPAGQQPTIFDLMRDMDSRQDAGLAMPGGGS